MASSAVVVVVGAGVVGVSTALFLSELGRKVVLVEKTRVAAAASGKAGGFLAREWGGGAEAELHRAGFDLHAELAAKLDVKSYRKLPTLQARILSRAKATAKVSASPGPRLLDAACTSSSMMDEGTAQVTPLELCNKLMAAAQAHGAELILCGAKSLFLNGTSSSGEQLLGVELDDGRRLQAEAVVLAMGPWTVQAEDWLSGIVPLRVPMDGIASSSAIVRPSEGVQLDATACFTSEDSLTQTHLELYPRPDNTLYVCGFGGSPHLDKQTIIGTHPDDVPFNMARLGPVRDALRRLTAEGVVPNQDGAVEESFTLQSCMRPCADDARPMIGKVPGTNLILATAHNCWGILLGPITGKAVAELIVLGEPCVDLTPYDPMRFTT